MYFKNEKVCIKNDEFAGAVTGRWGNATVDGLVGSSTDGGGYAFFGNTAWQHTSNPPLTKA